MISGDAMVQPDCGCRNGDYRDQIEEQFEGSRCAMFLLRIAWAEGPIIEQSPANLAHLCSPNCDNRLGDRPSARSVRYKPANAPRLS